MDGERGASFRHRPQHFGKRKNNQRAEEKRLAAKEKISRRNEGQSIDGTNSSYYNWKIMQSGRDC